MCGLTYFTIQSGVFLLHVYIVILSRYLSLFLALDRNEYNYNEYNYIKHYNFIAISQSAIFRIGSSHFICLFRIYCSFFVQILHHLETFH